MVLCQLRESIVNIWLYILFLLILLRVQICNLQIFSGLIVGTRRNQHVKKFGRVNTRRDQ